MMTQKDDGFWLIYNLLAEDEVIKQYCYSERDNALRIKFYEYPETADMTGNWIVIESIINGLPDDFSDDTWVTYMYLMHVEVWSRNIDENRIIANRIRDLLWEKIGFKQVDDHDEYDLGIFRDARRYRGTLHRSDLDKILKEDKQ